MPTPLLPNHFSLYHFLGNLANFDRICKILYIHIFFKTSFAEQNTCKTLHIKIQDTVSYIKESMVLCKAMVLYQQQWLTNCFFCLNVSFICLFSFVFCFKKCSIDCLLAIQLKQRTIKITNQEFITFKTNI